MPTPVSPATIAASSAPNPPGVGAAAAMVDVPRYTAPTWATDSQPSRAIPQATSAPTYARVSAAEPPKRAASRVGDLATATMLVNDFLMNVSTLVRSRWRPLRVAMPMPITASTTEMTTSSVLLDGSENPL